MNNSTLQKLGGFAALFEALAYVIGMVFFMLLIDSTATNPTEKVSMLAKNQVNLHIVTFIIYILFGIALVILAITLNERLKTTSSHSIKIATVFGLIWAIVVIASGMIYNVGMQTVIDLFKTDPKQAETVWITIETVHNALGGGTEILGGIWILLVSIAGIQSNTFPKSLNYFGIFIGASGILSDIPFLRVLGMVYGLTQIFWFIWLGIVLLKTQKSETVQTAIA